MHSGGHALLVGRDRIEDGSDRMRSDKTDTALPPCKI